MPSIIDFIEHFQDGLLRDERRNASALVHAYTEAWKRIRKQLDSLKAEMQSLAEPGESVGPDWLLRSDRAKALQAQIEKELLKFTRLAESKTLQEQDKAIDLALEQSRDLTEIAIGYGLGTFWNRINRNAVEIMIGMNQPGSPLHRLLNDADIAGAAAAQDALVQGVMLGYSPAKIAREIRDALGIALNRALTIARTEVLRAYREASYQSYNANADIVEGWQWLTAGDELVCLPCRLQNGTKHPITERMNSHPNCRCTAEPVTISWKELGEKYGMDFADMDNAPVDIDALAAKWGMSEKQVSRYKINQMGGTEWIRSLPEREQIKLMGNTRWEAWQSGKVKLEDMLTYRYSSDWGQTLAVKNLSELGLK